MRTKTNSIGL